MGVAISLLGGMIEKFSRSNQKNLGDTNIFRTLIRVVGTSRLSVVVVGLGDISFRAALITSMHREIIRRLQEEDLDEKSQGSSTKENKNITINKLTNEN